MMLMHMLTMEKLMIMKVTKLLSISTILCLLMSCAVSPGMKSPKIDNQAKIDGIEIIDINAAVVEEQSKGLENYLVSTGDILSIVVFGQNEFFPVANIGGNNPYTSRLVDQNGEIFFPYAGTIKVSGKTFSEIRKDITKGLSKTFNDPQVDVSIFEFNKNRNVYVLGEVKSPKSVQVGLVPLTLAEAIAQADGLSAGTSNGNRIFVIRGKDEDYGGKIFQASLQNSSQLVSAGQFQLLPGDIVFIGAADITLWNRFITQLFPFASFLNQVDNIQN